MGFSIGKKLVVNLGVAIATVLFLVGGSYLAMGQLAHLQDEGYHRAVESKDGLHAAHFGPVLYQIIADGLINRNMAETEADWQKAKAEGEKLMAAVIKYANSPEEKQWAEQGKKAYDELVGLAEGKLFPLLKASQEITPEMRTLDSEIDKQISVMEDNFNKYADSMGKEATDADILYDGTRRAAIRNTVIFGLLGLVFLLGVSLWIRRGITSPLRRLMTVLEDIAHGEGDLTRRLPVEGNDEVTEVSRSFNVFIEKLHDIISHVARTAVQLASAATHVYTTSEEIAEDTEKAAAQVITVATASEEMAATAMEISQNCGSASTSSQQAGNAASAGSAIVGQTIEGMHRIAQRVNSTAQTVGNLGERSDQIGTIVGTIEDIADHMAAPVFLDTRLC